VVWAGGVVFVASLIVCVYFYLIVWATPAPGSDSDALAINLAIFAVFALHHSVLARESVKRAVARLVPETLVRSLYVWTASGLLLLVLVLWRRVPGDVYQLTGWQAAGPALVQLAGLWLVGRAVALIDPLELAGIKPEPIRAPADTLQMTGPYRLVRHPIYLGWMLMVFGAAHMTADRLAFAVMTTAYVALAIPWEERSLLRAFGPAYERYQRVVRWRLVPFVY
jgi:protein-S-isoprenylcysteine O-methyltransferase Ste14